MICRARRLFSAIRQDLGLANGETQTAKSLADLGVKVLANISTDPGKLDFAAPVLQAKQTNADVIFVYTNEEEAARALRELRKQGVTKPIVGETVLTSQKVIELAVTRPTVRWRTSASRSMRRCPRCARFARSSSATTNTFRTTTESRATPASTS